MDSNYAESLLSAMSESEYQYNNDSILDALAFAAEAHEGQVRKSGEPYIYHPIEVAKILVSYHADEKAVIAALLHDTVEDTHVEMTDIRKHFGAEVALLVDGVTKLDKISYSSKEEQQIENIRKMLLAMAKDIRVILIKLADRLHNMRTLDSQPDAKRREKALETIEVFAPLAHRLGIQNLKSELEDTALKYLDPIGYKEITDNLEVFENDKFFEKIRALINKKLKKENLHATVEGRIKHIYSIYRKMFNQNKAFNEIYDLYAFRIIVDKVSECYNVLGYIHDIFHAIPGRLKDYIATPKPNMYQSLHTTVSYDGYMFEVQIRTEEMHRIAELGIAAHWKYKDGVFADKRTDVKLEWVRNLLETQKDMADADDFIKTFKIDLFADQVFVATPKGDIITLPADANVIDFAYAIHSEVGNKMIGAKINGRITELTTHPQNGDVIEILTSPHSSGPSRDWLKLVSTSEAKNKIRQWFKKEKREENILHGKEDLERELRSINVNFNNCTREELYQPILERYSFNDIDELYAAIGYGGISIAKILPKLKDHYSKMNKPEVPKAPPVIKKRKSINGIIVDNIDNCLVRLAGCCNPLPGDDIVGFVTRGYGVSVHKADCQHIKSAEEDRKVRVFWEGETNGYFAATLCIVAVNRFDLAVDITTILAGMRIVMHSINTHDTSDGLIRIYTNIDVHSLDHLESIAKKLRKIPNVLDVYRSSDKKK